jgi:hypothetical protein
MRTSSLDPFLLPVCPECGGPTNLSTLEPNPTREWEDLRTYQCAWCGKSQTLLVKRRPPARASR